MLFLPIWIGRKKKWKEFLMKFDVQYFEFCDFVDVLKP